MKEWIIVQPEEASVEKITQSLAISPLLARLLVNRGLKTSDAVNEFLYPHLAGLHDPFLFPQMEIAVDRVQQAIHRKERILIYGDYDADGLTGTALLYSVLRNYTDLVYTRIPHRLDEGYGLNRDAIQEEKQNGIDLIITIDCGITAVAEAKLATELGIDLIINDHHTPNEEGSLPTARAILHPYLPQTTYPFPGLAGVGSAFKFAQAISATLENKRSANLELLEYLDLVAIGTICDVVPLIGENRILTKFGLQQLTKTARPGLQALMTVAGIGNKKMDSYQVGFMLGPRLNAAGRMGNANVALNLLLTENAEQAIYYARQLNDYNQQRQQIEREILAEAEDQLQSAGGGVARCTIVLANESWHQGVLGIVAGKLAEKYARPVVLFALNEEEWAGSARGINGFNLMRALGQCENIKYGGHWKAAGITLDRTHLNEFRKQFYSVTTALLAETAGTPSGTIDAEITVPELTEQFLKAELPLLEPYGTDNPEPTFLARNLTLNAEPRLFKEKHLHLRFNSPENVTVTAMGYNWVNTHDSFPRYGEVYEVVFTPRINTYQRNESIELKIKDIIKTKN
ncbi:MAG: single-stranded-DNA-specific exonuclease RecJ [bacterium]|nr:single-stranded-DNA-specific exonuclease RecJ [bacterium]